MEDFNLDVITNSIIDESAKVAMNSFFNSLSSVPFTIDIPFLNDKLLIYFNSFNFIIICIILFFFVLFCFLFCFIGINRKLKNIRKIYESDLDKKYTLNTDILNEINNNLKCLNKNNFEHTTLEENIKFKSKKIEETI